MEEVRVHVKLTRSPFKTGRLEYHNAMNCRAKHGGKTWRGAVSPRNNGKPSASISPNPNCHREVDARVSRTHMAKADSVG